MRAGDKTVAGVTVSNLETIEARLKWLGARAICNEKACVRQEREYAKEAQELREQLNDDRSKLESAHAVGGADPGGEVIANLTGLSSKRVSDLTIAVFIIMVEVASTLGFPVLSLASRDFPHPEVSVGGEQKIPANSAKEVASDLSNVPSEAATRMPANCMVWLRSHRSQRHAPSPRRPSWRRNSRQ